MRLSRFSSYFGDSAFYRAVWIVMIPVVFQQFVSAAFSFVDSVMLANIDEFAMSAVAVANKPAMIYNALFFGFTGAASLLISQYHGAGKLEVCQRLFSVEIMLGFALSLLFAVALFLLSNPVMGMFVKDPYTIEAGVAYLRIIAWMYLPMSFSVVCLFSLRAIGITVLPMYVSFLTIVLSVAFEWLLIFGKFGLPRLGIRGAALGALFARTIEMCVYAFAFLRHKTEFRMNIAPAFKIGKPVLFDYIRKTLPLTVNELLWGFGQIAIFWAYARAGEAFLPAINVTDQVVAVSTVPMHAIHAAVVVLVGRKLGANQFDEARQNTKRLYGLSLILSLLCVGVAALLSRFTGHIFPTLTEEHLLLTKRFIQLMLFFFPTSAAYILSFLILRAGGDARNALLLDSGYLWLAPVPAALFTGIFLPDKISIFNLIMLIQVLQGLKLIVALRIVRRGTWLQNLTRENA